MQTFMAIKGQEILNIQANDWYIMLLISPVLSLSAGQNSDLTLITLFNKDCM